MQKFKMLLSSVFNGHNVPTLLVPYFSINQFKFYSIHIIDMASSIVSMQERRLINWVQYAYLSLKCFQCVAI